MDNILDTTFIKYSLFKKYENIGNDEMVNGTFYIQKYTI